MMRIGSRATAEYRRREPACDCHTEKSRHRLELPRLPNRLALPGSAARLPLPMRPCVEPLEEGVVSQFERPANAARVDRPHRT